MKYLSNFLSLNGLYIIKEDLFKFLKVKSFITFLKKAGIKPNHITLLNIVIGLSAVYFLFNNHFLFVLFSLLNYLLDALDGYYARNESLVTKLGNILDHGGDFAIGILFLLKTYLVLHNNFALLLISFAFLEILIIYLLNLWKYKFPSRMFLYLFFFKAYNLGLVIQVIYQPLSMLVVLYNQIFNKKSLAK